ncbi:interferon alpha/beta receptor 2-like [Limanda limanda]|uniref:interferon alpha/beta receptor 2-like n=1 Tax=Limanda limanda TaxID=27771 RepID=UPI0029C667B8|nr:interferon alpha/beta receptor 2-like [Limanda limanda]XP_060944083.1 interferon alpha/beta receptor 2-like [Limanda limanda]
MTPFIWMLTWLLQILLAMSELPPPVNLILTPSHMLKWQPGPQTPTGVYYNVTIITDKGTSWVPVAGCENVHYPLVCDLTGAFYDQREVHFVRVVTVQEGQASQAVIHSGYIPFKDTQLDLPHLTVTTCGRNLCVDLHPPMEHRREIYDTLSYKLKIECNSAERAKFFKDIRSLRRQILEDLAPGRQYCVSICILDKLESKASNYSQPVCSSTSGIYTADQWLSAVLCSLLMLGLVILVILVITGSICLKRRPLPLVLTTINHLEGILTIDPYSSSHTFLNVKPTLISSSEKRSNQSSDESDVESGTESHDGCRGDYSLRVGSSSLSAPLSREPEPQLSIFSNQISDFSSQPEVLNSQVKEIHPTPGLNHKKSTDTDSLTVGIKDKDREKKEVMRKTHNQDVNLLTLTFGRNEKKGVEESHSDLGEVEPQSHSASEEKKISLIQPSQTWDTKEVAIETVSCSSIEDVEEEEHAGYMGRPCTDVLQNFK